MPIYRQLGLKLPYIAETNFVGITTPFRSGEIFMYIEARTPTFTDQHAADTHVLTQRDAACIFLLHPSISECRHFVLQLGCRGCVAGRQSGRAASGHTPVKFPER